ncbi:PIH1 domain-containing 3 [Fasciolopsis buskii]|uniref:PIH1 domain-containing 3 n=1 Tax=Fasciolopsis buskii TaxID=27845 RepID=A0A8E0RWC4_9TREM|nr:PIH1 domain-containing 3 [Fasciolopsis buski]
MAKMKPSDIGPKKTKTTEAKGDENEKEKNLEDIWDVDEIPEGTQFEDVHDPRPQPEYELFYKQSVTTEDIYLQMGMKNPTTASCEFLVARIKLPETKSEDIKLDVKDKFLDLRTPKFKLGLYLPNPVDPDSSKANWSEDKEVLEVVMRNKREYDFLNE